MLVRICKKKVAVKLTKSEIVIKRVSEQVNYNKKLTILITNLRVKLTTNMAACRFGDVVTLALLQRLLLVVCRRGFFPGSRCHCRVLLAAAGVRRRQVSSLHDGCTRDD